MLRAFSFQEPVKRSAPGLKMAGRLGGDAPISAYALVQIPTVAFAASETTIPNELTLSKTAH